MAVLTLRKRRAKIEVKETTADIEAQKRQAGDTFRLHDANGQSFAINRQDILVMEDTTTWEG